MHSSGDTERLWELDEDTKPPDVAGSHKMGLLTQPLGEVRTIRGHSRALGGSETLTETAAGGDREPRPSSTALWFSFF